MMKKFKTVPAYFLIFSLLLIPLTGCSLFQIKSENKTTGENPDNSGVVESSDSTEEQSTSVSIDLNGINKEIEKTNTAITELENRFNAYENDSTINTRFYSEAHKKLNQIKESYEKLEEVIPQEIKKPDSDTGKKIEDINKIINDTKSVLYLLVSEKFNEAQTKLDTLGYSVVIGGGDGPKTRSATRSLLKGEISKLKDLLNELKKSINDPSTLVISPHPSTPNQQAENNVNNAELIKKIEELQKLLTKQNSLSNNLLDLISKIIGFVLLLFILGKLYKSYDDIKKRSILIEPSTKESKDLLKVTNEIKEANNQLKRINDSIIELKKLERKRNAQDNSNEAENDRLDNFLDENRELQKKVNNTFLEILKSLHSQNNDMIDGNINSSLQNINTQIQSLIDNNSNLCLNSLN
jgi:thymidylate kinase